MVSSCLNRPVPPPSFMDSLQHLGLFLALLGGILLMRPSILQTRDSSSSSSSVTRLRGIMGATPGTCGTRPLPIPSFLGRMVNEETRTPGHLPSLTHLTIEDACRGLQSGRFTSVALTKAYLARITEAAEFRAGCRPIPMHWRRPGNWTRSKSVPEPEGMPDFHPRPPLSSSVPS